MAPLRIDAFRSLQPCAVTIRLVLHEGAVHCSESSAVDSRPGRHSHLGLVIPGALVDRGQNLHDFGSARGPDQMIRDHGRDRCWRIWTPSENKCSRCRQLVVLIDEGRTWTPRWAEVALARPLTVGNPA